MGYIGSQRVGHNPRLMQPISMVQKQPEGALNVHPFDPIHDVVPSDSITLLLDSSKKRTKACLSLNL